MNLKLALYNKKLFILKESSNKNLKIKSLKLHCSLLGNENYFFSIFQEAKLRIQEAYIIMYNLVYVILSALVTFTDIFTDVKDLIHTQYFCFFPKHLRLCFSLSQSQPHSYVHILQFHFSSILHLCMCVCVFCMCLCIGVCTHAYLLKLKVSSWELVLSFHHRGSED